MKSTQIIFAAALLMLILGIVGWNIIDSNVSGQASGGIDENFSFGLLNVKARAVNEFGGMNNINALVEELFTTFGDVVASDVKSRIATAENLYQTSQRTGVAEIEVVKAINGLQLKFNTPEFAKTDLYEVRKLRLALQLTAPQFVGHGRMSEQSSTGDVNASIVPEMSPAEAVFVTLAMIHQKKANPNYQMTVAQRGIAWRDVHTIKLGQNANTSEDASRQLVNAVDDKLATLSAAEKLAIPHRALDILGIQ